MADTAWTAWYDEVLPSVPKAPRTLVANAVRDSAIELCQKGLVYLLESDAINVVANTKEYAWSKATVTNVESTSIWDVIYNGYELEAVNRDRLKQLFNNWSIQKGTPQYSIQLRPSVVRLVPYPTANITAGLSIWAFVQPLRTASGIVDEIGDNYFQTIAKGAKAKIMLRGRKMPYYDPAMGSALKAEFESEIAQAATEALEGKGEDTLEGVGAFY